MNTCLSFKLSDIDDVVDNFRIIFSLWNFATASPACARVELFTDLPDVCDQLTKESFSGEIFY